MVARGSGAIINASSVVGVYGNFGQSNYVATKSGVIGMTRVWARELGRKGVRVNAIAPGFIATDMTAKMPEDVLEGMKKKTPLGRLGAPEDVARAYVVSRLGRGLVHQRAGAGRRRGTGRGDVRCRCTINRVPLLCACIMALAGCAFALALGGCGGDKSGCRVDDDCAAGDVCAGGQCRPLVGGGADLSRRRRRSRRPADFATPIPDGWNPDALAASLHLQRRRHHHARRGDVHRRPRRALRRQRAEHGRAGQQRGAERHLGLLRRRSRAKPSSSISSSTPSGQWWAADFPDGHLRRAHRRRAAGLRRLPRRAPTSWRCSASSATRAA